MITVHCTVPALEEAFRRYNIRNATAIEVDGVVYLSGLTAVDLASGEMIDSRYEKLASLGYIVITANGGAMKKKTR